MPKLHLKRTPAEEAERQSRKSLKAAKRAAKKRFASFHHDSNPVETSHSGSRSPTHKRRRTNPDAEVPGYASNGSISDDMEYGPRPPPSSSRNPKPDYDSIRAQLEEERFREKMWGAFGDDERLDSVEAHFNDFAHIPNRWRSGVGRGTADDGDLDVDPQYMEEEEYAEWIRAGMWRKQHAEEHASKSRERAAKSAQRAREKALKAETLRLEKSAEEEWKRLKHKKERKRWDEAREEYDRKWRELLDKGEGNSRNGKGVASEGELRFVDIPWPVMAAYSNGKRRSRVVSLDDLTADAISTFLLPSKSNPSGDQDKEKKERKDKLRETMLRFHPDKFEGRVMKKVVEDERETVVEAVGIVVRVIGGLMGDG